MSASRRRTRSTRALEAPRIRHTFASRRRSLNSAHWATASAPSRISHVRAATPASMDECADTEEAVPASASSEWTAVTRRT